MGVGECGERGYGIRLGDHVRVGGEDVLTLCRGDPQVHVRGQAERPWVLEHAHFLRHGGDGAREVRDDDRLVDLGHERGKRATELRGVPV